MVKLEGKCLHYSSRITEEVFDQVVAKLESLGYRKRSDNQNDYTGFLKFKTLRFEDGKWDTRYAGDDGGKPPIGLYDILEGSTTSLVTGILKYDDSITEEIFDEILRVLEEHGIPSAGFGTDIQAFKKYGGLRIKEDEWRTVIMEYEHPTITVADILGTSSTSEIKGFPFKVGDIIRCDELNTWSSTCVWKYPIGICDGKEVVIEKVIKREDDYFSFQASYQGESYGFSYSSLNKYSLVSRPGTGATQRMEMSPIYSDVPTESAVKPIMITVPKL